jgi:hypothetical protein
MGKIRCMAKIHKKRRRSQPVSYAPLWKNFRFWLLSFFRRPGKRNRDHAAAEAAASDGVVVGNSVR